jgi:hypothetical protein
MAALGNCHNDAMAKRMDAAMRVGVSDLLTD